MRILHLIIACTTLLFSAQLAAHELPLMQAASGNFYVHAMLNDEVETNLLLDTGSGYVSLSRQTFAGLKNDTGTEFLRHITGRMANGRALTVPVYKIRALSLSADCVLRDIEVAVLPNADRDILGLNALRRMQPFTLDMDPPMLSSARCG